MEVVDYGNSVSQHVWIDAFAFAAWLRLQHELSSFIESVEIETLATTNTALQECQT